MIPAHVHLARPMAYHSDRAPWERFPASMLKSKWTWVLFTFVMAAAVCGYLIATQPMIVR